MKILIAAFLSAALIWLVPNANAQTINNSEDHAKTVKVAKVASAPKPAVSTAQVETPAPTPPPAPQPETPTTHEGLMAAAGIASSDFQYADYIVSHESTWGTFAQEPTSGAYGLCQSLPGYKMASAGSDWQSNPVTQLSWCNSYAIARYGGWASAYYHWVSNRNW